MKKTIKKLTSFFGYKISKKSEPIFKGIFSTPYECSLLSLLSCIDELKIVQVGANDGSINDPIYKFVRQFHKRTKILLVEPQEYLVPYLNENYSFHPNSFIYNGAIGPKGVLKLYSINKSYWKELNVKYAKDWPEYRAPTGVTSVNRQHVYHWLEKHLNLKNIEIDKVIQENVVPSKELLELLEEMNFNQKIDVLQIDAEGYDDQVIYNSNINETTPKIINFEVKNLPPEKFENLKGYLESRGYVLSCHGGEALAIMSEGSCASNK